jgi:hypothetical protein
MRAFRIGTTAAEQLGQAGWNAQVMAVMSQAIYLRDCEGEILWISPEGSTPHRRAILAPLRELGWQVGAACFMEDQALCVRRGAWLSCRDVPIWREPAPERSSASLAAARCSFRIAVKSLSCTYAPRGLALLRAEGCGSASEASGCTISLDACWATEAATAVIEAVESCSARDTGRLLQAGDRLVGLGTGLTPSGDDFLGGLLFSRRHTEQVFGLPPLDWKAIYAWLEDIRTRTSTISYAILSDMARGHGPEPLHDMVSAIASGKSFDQIALHAARLVQIGQTSGWDMLTGVAAGMDVFPFVEAGDASALATIGEPAGLFRQDAATELAAARGAHGE